MSIFHRRSRKNRFFRVCKTVKITKIPKITIFFSKIFFSKKSILKYWFGLCGDLNTGAIYPVGHTGPDARPMFSKNMVAPVDGMALLVSASGQKSCKNHDFGVWHPMGAYIWGCEICMESTYWGCYRSWGPTWVIFHAIGSRESDFDIFSSILAVTTLQKHWFWGVSETVRYTQGHIRYYSGRRFEKTTTAMDSGVPDSVYAPKWIHGKTQNRVSDTCCHKWQISKVEIFRKSGFSTRCTQSWGPKFFNFLKKRAVYGPKLSKWVNCDLGTASGDE